MSKWYITQTKPRQEKLAQENLERQGYKTYCPRIMHSRHRRGVWQIISEPLFPRYLFMQLIEGKDDFAPIRSTKGVSKLLRFGEKPAIISQQAIDMIRYQEQLGTDEESRKLPLKQGDRIQILEGPFSGLKGIFEKKCGEKRVFVLLELLGRENRLTLDINKVVHA